MSLIIALQILQLVWVFLIGKHMSEFGAQTIAALESVRAHQATQTAKIAEVASGVAAIIERLKNSGGDPTTLEEMDRISALIGEVQQDVVVQTAEIDKIDEEESSSA